MNKPAKAILGVLTILAPVSLVAAAPLGHWYIMSLIKSGAKPHLLFHIMVASSFILWFGSLAFYRTHMSKTNAMPADKKRHWLKLLQIYNLFVIPVYWYRFIWKQEN